ncbi:hypothetical protein [Streptomyces sp.]
MRTTSYRLLLAGWGIPIDLTREATRSPAPPIVGEQLCDRVWLAAAILRWTEEEFALPPRTRPALRRSSGVGGQRKPLCGRSDSGKLRRMDWMPLLSTLTGAVIGIAATLIADRNRWRREESRQALELRREVYTEFVSALKAAGEEIRAVALGDHMSESARDAAVREAFRGSGMYTASERLWLVGPTQVVAAGNEAFHSLRRIRDAYARGVAVGSAEDAPLVAQRRTAMAQMRGLMREDLGIGPLEIE